LTIPDARTLVGAHVDTSLVEHYYHCFAAARSRPRCDRIRALGDELADAVGDATRQPHVANRLGVEVDAAHFNRYCGFRFDVARSL